MRKLIVCEKEYELKPITEAIAKGKNIRISELINIDLDSYNNEIVNFEKEFGMSLNSTLLIQMEVSMISKIGQIEFNNDYFTNIQIGLGQKTTQVQGDLRENESNTIREDYTQIKNRNIIVIVLYIVILVLAVLGLRYVVINTKGINILRNSYKIELNRILKSCN